jgi:hypothetical protein
MVAHAQGATALPTSSLPTSSPRIARWGQDRRLEFIEYRIRWAGHLNRSDLVEFFGISVPQASLDLAEYTRRAPQNLNYDRSTRTYVLAETFDPIFDSTSHERYLNDLLRDASATEPLWESFLGWHPPVAVTPTPGRHIPATLIASIIDAIRLNSALEVNYQSLSRPLPYLRTITPHALAHDGQRWHVRAYCHVHHEFRDFVISRILSIQGTKPDVARGADDRKWHHKVRLVLAPHPDLSEAQRRAIELDFGMTNERCELQCRQAFLIYVLRQLRLDRKQELPAEAQQIILQNRAELEHLLPSTEFR